MKKRRKKRNDSSFEWIADLIDLGLDILFFWRD